MKGTSFGPNFSISTSHQSTVSPWSMKVAKVTFSSAGHHSVWNIFSIAFNQLLASMRSEAPMNASGVYFLKSIKLIWCFRWFSAPCCYWGYHSSTSYSKICYCCSCCAFNILLIFFSAAVCCCTNICINWGVVTYYSICILGSSGVSIPGVFSMSLLGCSCCCVSLTDEGGASSYYL